MSYTSFDVSPVAINLPLHTIKSVSKSSSAEPVAAYWVWAYPTFVIIDPNVKILDIKEGASGFYEIIKKYIPDAEVEKKLKEASKS